MALDEGKKSFVVYCSWFKYIEDLSNEQVGEWTRWMFEFTNDVYKDKERNYPSDPAVKMLCKMTEQQLSLDLDKYRERVERIKKNGKQYKTIDNQNKSSDNIVKNIDTDIETEVGTDVKTDVETNVGGVYVYDKCKMLNVYDKCNNKKESIKENEASTLSSSTLTEMEKPLKHKYGQYQTVLLTDEEYDRLVKEFGKPYIYEVISRIDEYKKMNGNKNKWKEDNLVIRKAIREKWTMLKGINPKQEHLLIEEEDAI